MSDRIMNSRKTRRRLAPSEQLREGIGDEHPGDGVEPVAVMPDVHVLPGLWTAHVGYERLLAWLESAFGLIQVTPGGPPGNLLPVAYDWRLSNRYNGRCLKNLVEPALQRWRGRGGEYADARVVFICHSMGGLVARWYIQREGGAEITRKLITLGTPHRGAVSSLEQLVNGVRKGPGRFGLDLTEFARSLPSTQWPGPTNGSASKKAHPGRSGWGCWLRRWTGRRPAMICLARGWPACCGKGLRPRSCGCAGGARTTPGSAATI